MTAFNDWSYARIVGSAFLFVALFIASAQLGMALEYLGITMWLVPLGLAVITAFAATVPALGFGRFRLGKLCAVFVAVLGATALLTNGATISRQNQADRGADDRLVTAIGKAPAQTAAMLSITSEESLDRLDDRLPVQVAAELQRRSDMRQAAERDHAANERRDLIERERRQQAYDRSFVGQAKLLLGLLLWIVSPNP